MSDRLVEIHINMQGRVIVRYDGGKCVDVTDTRGRKLYSAQAQAGDGEAVGWQYQHEDTGRTTFVTHAEASEFEELNSRRWHKTIQLYAAPPAVPVNQQLLEALDKLISVAEMCDSWESFPSKALDEARAAIAAAQEQSK